MTAGGPSPEFGAEQAAAETLAAIREDYAHGGLQASHVDADPMVQLRRWIDEAMAAGAPDPTAMTLATADVSGRPDARVVLCKGVADDGIAFYTNLDSPKAAQLADNPRATAVFLWHVLHRQVRVSGLVRRLPAATADAYFASRPRASQIGAWASPQSQPVADRRELERRVLETARLFGEEPVPRPPHWGGYLIEPDAVELWQGRPSRLHDRLRYQRQGDGWTLERLGP